MQRLVEQLGGNRVRAGARPGADAYSVLLSGHEEEVERVVVRETGVGRLPIKFEVTAGDDALVFGITVPRLRSDGYQAIRIDVGDLYPTFPISTLQGVS